MAFQNDFSNMLENKDLSDPVEKMCFDIMIETLLGSLLGDTPESYQKAMLDFIKTTGPNKA
jgi:hypothetical protein